MKRQRRLILSAFFLTLAIKKCYGDHFTNVWVAHIPAGVETAQEVAKDLGFNLGRPVLGFQDHFELVKPDHHEMSNEENVHLTRSLLERNEVGWSEQQRAMRVSQRGMVPENNMEAARLGRRGHGLMKTRNNKIRGKAEDDLAALYQSMGVPYPGAANKNPGSSGGSNKKPGSSIGFGGFGTSNSPTIFKPVYSANDLMDYLNSPAFQQPHLKPTAEQKQAEFNMYKSKFPTTPCGPECVFSPDDVTPHINCRSNQQTWYKKLFDDQFWIKQWYVQDYRKELGPVMDHNVVPVYAKGITGKGVIVAVVDEPVLHTHRDLQNNFLMDLSYDYCKDKPGNYPEGNQEQATRVAGVVAMEADNGICGVGIAYEADIVGVNALCNGVPSSLVLSRAVTHELHAVSIYSCNWGPVDDGLTMEREQRLTVEGFNKGISEGRENKGSIYIFPSGNGKHNGDNCAADWIQNQVGVITIAAASQSGKSVYYGERCTAIFATAYSGSMKNGEEKIVAPTSYGMCDSSLTGSTAAGAIATGIIALVLQARPELTYRDVMHLIAYTSEVAPLADNDNSWYKNRAGFWVSNDFGFGLLNAENMVNLAKTWKKVPDKHICPFDVIPEEPYKFKEGETVDIFFTPNGCQDEPENAVRFLEHVEVISDISYPYRGAIIIKLTPESGKTSTLLERRPLDSSGAGLQRWRIKSVHNWGENPNGHWVISVTATSLQKVRPGAVGLVKGFTVVFHGTSRKPDHYKKPRVYAAFRTPETEEE